MGLKINQNLVNKETAEQLVKICPFGAISYDGEKLEINAACKTCKMCVRKGPAGVVTFQEDVIETVNKDEYKGICVYADVNCGVTHKVTFELIGKALQLAKVINQEVYVLMIGYNLEKNAKEILDYGVSKVFVYDDKKLEFYDSETYGNCFIDYIKTNKPSSVLVGATNIGRNLAPKVAAYFRTGLTADCTKLEMKENTDLVQIRPAFGGNIMAQIVNPNRRPQFATVRYKIFDAAKKVSPIGTIINVKIDPKWLESKTTILKVENKEKQLDISECDVLVAVGRGVKSKEDLKMIEELANLLGATIACSRPMVENGTFDCKHQIGLSGKTVKPKLLITIGISGAIQFVSGMKSSETIISINSDPKAPIFDVCDYGIVGDLYKIVPELISKLKEAK